MDSLKKLLDAGVIRPLDHAFAEFVAQHENQHVELVGMLASLLSSRLAGQNICLDIDKIGQPFAPIYYFPEQQLLSDFIHQSSMIIDVAKSNSVGPLVLEGNSLYIQKYWDYEQRLALMLRERSQIRRDFPESELKSLVDRLFTDNNEKEVDWQKVAVCVAARSKLSVITGGPGTGKTTTVTRLLAVLQGISQRNSNPITMQLVAPTGKAAARLSESIQQAKTKLPEDLRSGLETNCSTIHRLLGSLPNRSEFKHNKRNKLHLDLLIVDEASMIDLPLMCKLFEALPNSAAVVMLGDKNQLSSVEAGSVMSDICAAVTYSGQHPAYSADMFGLLNRLCGLPYSDISSDAGSVLQDNLVTLQKSFRFSASSGIGNLASAINRGDLVRARHLLSDNENHDLAWYQNANLSDLIAKLLPNYKQYLTCVKQGDLKGAFAALQKQQVLCTQRQGAWGVNEINLKVEKELAKQGIIDLSSEYYPGRPIMLTQNDHRLKLYNGDIGVIMPDPDNPSVRKAWFLTSEGDFKGVLPSRIPSHDTQYAMTIHKSQGSEFDNVFMVLQKGGGISDLSGLSRELVYTGLTRAKQSFSLYADEQVLGRALAQQCLRSSGLQRRLQ